jgi:hypothetical protein
MKLKNIKSSVIVGSNNDNDDGQEKTFNFRKFFRQNFTLKLNLMRLIFTGGAMLLVLAYSLPTLL